MRKAKSRIRRPWMIIAISFWLVVGIVTPLILGFDGDQFQIDSAGVVAAPHDKYQITNTLLIERSSGLTVSGGSIALMAAKDIIKTAEAAATHLAAGTADLLLSDVEIGVGRPDRLFADGVPSVAAPLAAALQEGRYRRLHMKNSTLVVTMPDGHRERVTRATVGIVPSANGAVQAKGEGFWRGLRSKFILVSRPIDESGMLRLSLKFKSTLLDFTYDGTLSLEKSPELAGASTINLRNTDRLASALGTTWPISTAVQNVSIEGPLRWSGSTLAFDRASVTVGNSTGEGTVSLKTEDEEALITSTLAFQKLDVAPYLPANVAGRRAIVWNWWNKLVSTLARPAGAHINADIRISAKSMLVGKTVLGPAAASIAMNDGRFTADIAEVSLGRARAMGQMTIDFKRFIPK